MPICLITPESMLHKPGPHVDLLTSSGFEVRYPQNPILTRGTCSVEETVRELSIADALMAGGEVLSAEILKQLPRLQAIARFGVGYDKVHIATATELKIPVTITPTANHEAAAETALSLMFAVTKHTALNDRRLRSGFWSQAITRPIRGTTLGIVGLGRIGRSLAVRAKSLGMNVIATEQFPDQQFCVDHGIRLLPLAELLSQSDTVSVHCPLNAETRGLFNTATFAQMKPGSIFINTARGGVMVEADLIAALKSGHLFGAGLDVFEKEPLSADNPLLQVESVVLSPHLAGTDLRSVQDMANECARCITELYAGRWPDAAVVNRELRETFRWKHESR